MSLGYTLALARKAENLHQRDLASKIGVSASTLSAWERDITAPDANTLRALADILRVSADVLLERRPFEWPERAAAPASAACPSTVDRFAALLAKCGPPPIALPPDIPPRSKKNRRKTPTNPMIGSEAVLAGKRMAEALAEKRTADVNQ